MPFARINGAARGDLAGDERKPWTRALAALAVLSVLSLAACNGDGGTSATAPDTPETTVIIPYADADSKGADFEVVQTFNASGFWTHECVPAAGPDRRDPPSVSAELTLDCTGRTVSGEVRFRLFTRMLLSDGWVVGTGFSLEQPPNSYVELDRAPIAGTSNLWTEIVLKTPAGTKLEVKVKIFAFRKSSGPRLTCGPRNQVFHDPLPLQPGVPVSEPITSCASS